VSGPDDPLLFPKADGIFRRISIFAGFDFDEDKDISFPGDDIDFSRFRTVRRGGDPVAERAKVVDCLDFGPAAEGKQAVKE
jgi:hypothetical protein